MIDDGKLVKELRVAANIVFLATEEDIAHDLSGKLNRAANTIEKMHERERRCPTMLESEARALLYSLQEIAQAVGVGASGTPRETVKAVRCLVMNKHRCCPHWDEDEQECMD